MSPKDAFARDTIAPSDPRLDLLWKGRKIRDEYQGMADSLAHPGINCSNDPGLTDQSQAAETDVNFILKRAQQSGVLPGIDVERQYADVSNAMDYHEAQNIVINAQNQFNALNASLRKKFDNDPALFLAFAEDPKNAQELVTLGLAKLRPPSPAVPAPEAAAKPEPVPEEPKADSKPGNSKIT